MDQIIKAVERLQEKDSPLQRFIFKKKKKERKKEKVPLCTRWESVNLVESVMQYFLFF